MNTVARDDDTQKNGIVTVVLNRGPNRVFFEKISYFTKFKQTLEGIPYRLASVHYVYDEPFLYPLVTFANFLLRSRVKGRFLPFLGTLIGFFAE